MIIEKIEKFNLKGLKVRTNNESEVSGKSDKISSLWDKMTANYLPSMLASSKIYAVCHNYESDVNGDYDLLVGADKFADNVKNLEILEIKEGNYLKFTAVGEMPKACIDLWQEIWTYFNSEKCEFERAYTTDFEKYTQNGVEIYIAIK